MIDKKGLYSMALRSWANNTCAYNLHTKILFEGEKQLLLDVADLLREESIDNDQELPLVQDRIASKSDEDIRTGIEISRQKYENEKKNSDMTYKLFEGVDELAERLRKLH